MGGCRGCGLAGRVKSGRTVERTKPKQLVMRVQVDEALFVADEPWLTNFGSIPYSWLLNPLL